MRFHISSLSCAFICGFLLWSADASCYYPDGTFPTDYVYQACSGDEFTSCCIPSEGDQCLSNGLCYYPSSEYMFRGACTDKTWESDKCFQHCNSEDASGTYNELVPCGDNRYCCSSDGSTCCNDDTKVFDVGPASVIKDLASTASYTLFIETPTAPADFVTDPATSARTTNSESQTKSTASASASKVSNIAAEATSTAPSADRSKSSSKIPIIAGAGAGAVILIASICTVWFFVRRRYRKRLAASSNAFPMSGDGFQRLPNKTPRPVEVPVPLQSPAPPYQPHAYGYTAPPPQHNAVEIDESYRVPGQNQYGQPIYEAPTQAHGL